MDNYPTRIHCYDDGQQEIYGTFGQLADYLDISVSKLSKVEWGSLATKKFTISPTDYYHNGFTIYDIGKDGKKKIRLMYASYKVALASLGISRRTLQTIVSNGGYYETLNVFVKTTKWKIRVLRKKDIKRYEEWYEKEYSNQY